MKRIFYAAMLLLGVNMALVSCQKEQPTLALDSPTLFYLSSKAQNIEIDIQTNVQCLVDIDNACKDWITQVGTKASSSSKLVFNIAANTSNSDREGRITISASRTISQVICVKQSRVEAATIEAEAGKVQNLLETYDCGEIKYLTILGHIDASDFRYIKWNCINLEQLDVSDVIIDRYVGENGTNEGYEETYPENEIPMGAFFYWMDRIENGVMTENETKYFDEGMPSLKSVKLPVGIKAIRRNAFARAYNLTEINIPEGVEIIDYVSFRYCSSLTEITLPSTIKTLGQWAFTAMPNLKTVYCKSSVPPSTNQSFGELYDSDNRGRVYIPTYNTNKKIETLYVPKGCKQAYESWTEYFEKIVEE